MFVIRGVAVNDFVRYKFTEYAGVAGTARTVVLYCNYNQSEVPLVPIKKDRAKTRIVRPDSELEL